MKRVLLSSLLFLLCAYAQDSVPLTQIKTLTLHKGKLTRGRRGAPVQQLECVGGDACSKFNPQVMQCYNQGTDHTGEVQWTCKAEMENLYRLGTTTVSCEGYFGPEDTNVLSGSCGVEYTLHLTEKGKRHFAPRRPVQQQQRIHHKEEYSEPIVATIVVLLIIVVLIICIANCNYGGPSSYQSHHYATRGTTTVYDDATPTVIHRRSRPAAVIIDEAPTVVHHRRSAAPIVVEENSWNSQPTTYERSPSPVKTYTSTGYGGTKKR